MSLRTIKRRLDVPSRQEISKTLNQRSFQSRARHGSRAEPRSSSVSLQGSKFTSHCESSTDQTFQNEGLSQEAALTATKNKGIDRVIAAAGWTQAGEVELCFVVGDGEF
ncbi:hypothetical protein BGX34_006033, partial [Mortierella sp. NVP85]